MMDRRQLAHTKKKKKKKKSQKAEKREQRRVAYTQFGWMRGNMTSSDIIASAVYGMKKKNKKPWRITKKKKNFR